MSADFDVIVVGSGPAGVSAAFPLVEAGLKVLLVDGGRESQVPPPAKPYLISRKKDEDQWEWMVGQDYHALRQDAAASPKFRTPTHAYVFDGFNTANRIVAHDFIAVGSLARGGLSNAWGCGVARLSRDELRDFPFAPSEIEPSYEAVTRRMGVSGAVKDDLSEYFGLDEWADPPIPMDTLQSRLLNKYATTQTVTVRDGFKLGRSRVAALSRDRSERKACDLSGNCLWGCRQKALYSATEDLDHLKRHANFTYRCGFIVDDVAPVGNLRAVKGGDATGRQTLTARKIILAAGTIATTRLALQALKLDKSVTMQACPTAAFMLWLPAALGNAHAPAFGLGQLSFTIPLQGNVPAFGSLFNTTGLPVAEFIRHMPFRKRYGIDLLKAVLGSCVVGNLFLPGSLSTATLALRADGTLHVTGGYREEVHGLMRFVEQRLRNIFWKLGALLPPGSFTLGHPGSDIHYACSLPMRINPAYGETDAFGELFGLDGVYIADGASLSALSEKSHTLTIMANADRISRRLASDL